MKINIILQCVFLFLVLGIAKLELSDKEKADFISDLDSGEECYKKLIESLNEDDKSNFKHESPKEFYSNFIKNQSCGSNPELCIQGAIFGVKSYLKQLNQLCNEKTDATNSNNNITSSLLSIKTKIADADFFNFLEIGEACYAKLGEFKTYVKNPVLNYNTCYKRCLENKENESIIVCTEECFHNSIINIAKVCELNDLTEETNESGEGNGEPVSGGGSIDEGKGHGMREVQQEKQEI